MLWDVDGTLLNSTRLVRDARARAVRTVYGLEGELRRVAGGGMTDPQLTLEVLALHGWSEARALERLDAFRDVYLANLTELAPALRQDLVVLPGVREVLAGLHALDVKQSLLTGNYESAARLKVAAAGLDHYLDLALGAFGSDHRDRLCLVPVALDKVRLQEETSCRKRSSSSATRRATSPAPVAAEPARSQSRPDRMLGTNSPSIIRTHC